MRTLISALVITASLAAQYTGEGPYLYTNPPVTDANFNGARLGVAGPIAQIEFTPMRDASGNPVADTFYITATWVSGATYPPTAAIWNAVTNIITPMPGDVAVLGLNGFACNVSNDLLVVCWDSGAATAPVLARRANTGQPFGNLVAISGVPATFNDSTLYDKDPAFAPNGYKYGYISGNTLNYVTVDITTGAVLSGVTQTVNEAIAVHSQMPMRQQTGNFFDIGKARAMAFSKNDSSADSFFRSSLEDRGSIPVPIFRIYDDANWKANPGHMGGNIYYAYATSVYGDPLLHKTLCCSSAHVPPGGGLASIIGWSTPRAAAPIFGTIIIGAAGLNAGGGIDLSFMGVAGKLGLNPASLIVLPLQVFDFGQGEIGYDLPVNINQPTTIHYQVLSFNSANSSIALGNTAQLDVR